MNRSNIIASVPDSQIEQGFTLIEMMVGMAMGLLLLAGLTKMFVSMNDTSRAVSSRSEQMGDLYLASHIMQTELRESQALCWDTTKNRIIYQPLDSTVVLNTVACNAVDATHGSFESKPVKAGKPTPYVCWDRPDKGDGCQELMRDMSASNPPGLAVVQSANLMWTITLTSSYLNESKTNKTLSLRFKTWNRN